MGPGSASAAEAERCFELAMEPVAAAGAGTGLGVEVAAAEFAGAAAEAGCDQSGTVLAAVVGLALVVRRN